MGVIIRQSFKATIANYIGVVLGAFNTLFLFPLILTSTEIGLIRLLSDIALLFSSVAQFGISVNMIKFFPAFKNDEKNHNGFFFFTLLQPIVGFLITSLMVLLFKDQILSYYAANSPLILSFFNYVFPFALSILFLVYLETTSSLVNRIAVPKFIREVLIRIMVISSLFIYYMKWINFEWLVISQVLIYVVAVLVNLFYANRLIPIRLKPDFSLFTPKFTREVVVYSLFTVVGSLSSIIVAKIDTIMIGSMEGLSNTGIYSISFFIALFIETPHRALITIAMPILSEAINKNDFVKIKDISTRTSVNQFLIASFLFLMIIANIDNLFSIMPHGAEYSAGKYVVVLIGVTKLIEMISGLNSPLIGFRHYKFGLFITLLISVLMIVTNLYFIPKYSITGAAIATLISTFVVHLLMHLFVIFRMKFSPVNKEVVINAVMLGLLLGLNYFIPFIFNVWIDILIRSSLLGVFFLFATYQLKLSHDLNELVDTRLLKKGRP